MEETKKDKVFGSSFTLSLMLMFVSAIILLLKLFGAIHSWNLKFGGVQASYVFIGAMFFFDILFMLIPTRRTILPSIFLWALALSFFAAAITI